MPKKAKQPPSPPSTSIDPVTAYANAVLAGEILAGHLVRRACERHLRDLEDGHERGLHFDVEKVERVIGFFREMLCLTGGEHDAEPFVLDPSQEFIVGSLFGWLGPDGYRRFRVAYVEEGKGNGKTPLAAGICLYMLVADGEFSPEVYAAAVDKDQANILFRDAVAMVRRSKFIHDKVRIFGGAGREHNIAYLERGGFFRPLASEARGRGKSGPRVHCAILDEVHEHPTGAMVEFMRAGTKGRNQALIVLITNSGHDRTTVCYQYHAYAEKVVESLLPEGDTDSFFGFVCTLDEGDDWKDEAVWLKTNPLLDKSITRKYLREQVSEALGMPAKQNIVRRLNFCEWTEADASWLTRDAWRNIEADIDVKALIERPCWGGLDLSSKKDLTALTLVFEPGEDGIWDAVTWLWTPGDTVHEREDRDGAPYSVWIREKHLIAVDGPVIDFGWVAAKIGELQEDFDLQAIAFDPHKIDYLQAELEERGIECKMICHSQGYYKPKPPGIWMPNSVAEIEAMIEKRQIRVKRNPVMAYCAASAVIVADEQENKKFSKKKATGRIDGVVSLTMAVGLALQAPEPESMPIFIAV